MGRSDEDHPSQRGFMHRLEQPHGQACSATVAHHDRVLFLGKRLVKQGRTERDRNHARLAETATSVSHEWHPLALLGLVRIRKVA